MTITQAVINFIEADSTLAAKVAGRCYSGTLPQMPGACNAVVKVVSLPSWSSHDGATSAARGRIEVTFWCKLAADAESLALRFRSIVAQFNGSMSGVAVAVFQTLGPRTVFHPDSRHYGFQVDFLATIDMATAS